MSIASMPVMSLDPPPLDQRALPTQTWRGWIFWTVFLTLTLTAYIIGLSLYYAPAIVHPDANGYWAQGSLLWQTGHAWFKPSSDAEYIGMHWLLLGDDTFLSRYPPGFPLFIGMIQHFFGWPATVLINPVLAVLTLIGVYLTIKRFASPGWGIAAVAILAVNSAFTVHALTQISHMPVAFCVVWGFYFLIRWSQKPRLHELFLAGMLLGCIPSTRYADAIVALGVGLFLLLHIRRVPRIWAHYLAAIIGAMIPITPLLIRNQLMFGAFWKTGYALTNEQTGFSWQNMQDHAIPYLQMLQSGGMGMMFGLGLIGMLWMLFVSTTRKTAVLLLSSTIPFLLVYMAYYWAMGVGAGGMGGRVGGAMRFLVPIVPLFVIAGAWALSQATHTLHWAGKLTIGLAIVAMQILMYGDSLRQEILQSYSSKSTLALATREIDANVPEGSVIVADNQLLQQLDFVRKWKLADASLFGNRGRMGGGGGGGGANRPGNFGGRPGQPNDTDEDLPSPQQQAKNEARQKLYTGTERERQRKFEKDIDAWAGKGEIYVVAKESDLSRLLPLAQRSEFVIVKTISTPKPPPVEESTNPMSRMGRGGPAGMGGRGGRPGGMFGSFIQPGEEFVIAKWVG